MTADEVEIRQATAAGDRVKEFSNGSILGLPEPTDGIQENALRFLWPGTVTMSAERAYQIWHGLAHHVGNGQDALGNKVLDDAWKVKDNESGETFFIDSLTFGPVRMVVRDVWTNVYPLVVKPCPLLETPAVRAALHRVADAAKELRGHYRFFGYTRAAAGLDSWKVGPPMLETEKPDPASPCTGVKPLVPVRDGDTLPMVCSSIIWLAVHLVNDWAETAKPPYPRIILDGRPQLSHFDAGGDYGRSMCKSFYLRKLVIDKINSQTPDGLYFYSKDERADAAKWLYDYWVKTVRDEIDKALPGLFASLGIGVGVGLTVQKLLALLTSWNAGAVAVLLGFTPLFPDVGRIELELGLQEPPDTRRELLIEGKRDLVNRYAIGEDWWAHPQFVLEPALIGLDCFPDEPEFTEQRKASIAQPRRRQEQVDDWGQADLQCVLEIQNERSIKVMYKARLKDDDDDWQDEGTFSVPPKVNNADPGMPKVIDLVRSEMAWPVRAHIEFTVHNNHAP